MEKNKTDSSIPTKQIAISVNEGTPTYSTASPHTIPPFDNPCILYHIYLWTVAATSIIGIIKIITIDKNQYVDVHGLFFWTTFVILGVTGFTFPLYGLLLFFQIATKEFNKTLLKTSQCFSVILAPVSLVIAVIFPPKLCRIGYSIICATFAIIVIYNLISYIILINKKAVVCNVKDDQVIKDVKKNNHSEP